jgi:hypothetical protein
MAAIMLTTIDNPFNPFTQWDEWKSFDEDKGYFTCSYLARIAKTSDELSDVDYELAVEEAINEICELNTLGLYKKVSSSVDEG